MPADYSNILSAEDIGNRHNKLHAYATSLEEPQTNKQTNKWVKIFTPIG